VEVTMNAVGDRRILIVEDDEDWREIIAEAIGDVLHDLGREADFDVMHADDEQEALGLLKQYSFALVSMDINLSNVTKGTSEGLDLLNYLEASAADTCSIIVSGEVKPEYILNGFQKYNILRFIGKAPWDGQELRTTVKSILLYTEALRHLSAGAWKKAVGSWERACQVAPELGKRFKDISELVERKKLEAHHITGLPTGDAVDSMLREFLGLDTPWGILYVDVENLEAYYNRYGHVEGDSALKTVARLLQDRAGQAAFLGYADRGLFIVAVEDRSRARSLSKRLLDSLEGSYSNLYPYQELDEETGSPKPGVPELRLNIRMVSDQDGPFADIREISRMGSGSGLD
jgi:GGDEF domain-containing protein/CheY-like chemotaxis protein